MTHKKNNWSSKYAERYDEWIDNPKGYTFGEWLRGRVQEEDQSDTGPWWIVPAIVLAFLVLLVLVWILFQSSSMEITSVVVH